VADLAPPGTPATWKDAPGRVVRWDALHPGWPRPWVVLTANSPDAEAETFVEPAAQFLQQAKASLEPSPKNNRALPLLALPVIGAGHAGGARKAGEIVKHLLPELYAFTKANAIDVALVMKDGAQYAAAQAVRCDVMGEQAWPELDDSLQNKVNHLA
jgi:hypothetical protein